MFTRTRLLLVAVVAPLALIAATTAPASAAGGGVAAIQGSGSISPGLSAVPAGQTFNFNGTATVVGVINGGAEVATSHSITASGSDLAGSYAEGAGTIALNVSGLPPMMGVFVRVGVAVVVAVTGPLVSAGTGACTFVAGQVPVPVVHSGPPTTVTFPLVTTYSVVCAALAVA